MKYPKIKSASITIARNYAYIFTVYESGRRIMKHIDIEPESVMLYPMNFLKETRSITHIINQLAVNGCIPMSIDNWMYKEHPHASFRQHPFDCDIFTMRLDADEKMAETLGYERFNY